MVPIRKKRTWNDNLNGVIRALFESEELKELLLIPLPERENLVKFVEKYVVNDVIGETLVQDEKVRVLWYTSEGVNTRNHHVIGKYIQFDIFVKRSELYTADEEDGLRARDKMISDLLVELLTDNRYVSNMRFEFLGDFDASSKPVGFSRTTALFSFKSTW